LVQLSPGAAVYPARHDVLSLLLPASQPATIMIMSNPERVCLDHALEFWTGLLVYAKDVPDRCLGHDRLCTCRSCEELSASDRRAMAIAAAGPSPRDQEPFPVRLAS
jgi:hypothetical protein